MSVCLCRECGLLTTRKKKAGLICYVCGRGPSLVAVLWGVCLFGCFVPRRVVISDSGSGGRRVVHACACMEL